jgi:hypothetical protein
MLEAAARSGIPIDLSAQGLISAVVQHGVRTGQLCQGKVKGTTGFETLWLTESEPRQGAIGTNQSESIRESPAGILNAAPEALVANEPRPKTAPTYARSGELIKCLENRKIYCEKRVRDIFFQILEETTKQGNKLTVARLQQEFVSQAGQISDSRLNLEPRKWDKAANYMVKLLLLSEVLHDDQSQAIKRSDPAAMSKPVHGVAEGFRDVAEAYLLLCLVKDLGNITEDDHRAIAHALFRQFDQSVPLIDLEERVALLFALLKDEISKDEEGRYSPQSRATVLPMRAAPGA